MKKSILLLFLLVSISTLKSNAQNTIFLSKGKVEFERKINLYAQIDDDADDGWKDLAKKTIPKFMSSYFDLEFNNDKTLYKPGRENPDNNKIWRQPADDNIVFTDFGKSNAISQKGISGDYFLVNDSTRKIIWKITDETRNIAGFNCRRANGLIMDSIYIVGFYTDEIVVPGGPESFSGLPGMILGIAIPHEHITWFATKVSNEDVPVNSMIPPKKGIKVTNKEMLAKLKDAMKDYGKWANRYIKAVML